VTSNALSATNRDSASRTGMMETPGTSAAVRADQAQGPAMSADRAFLQFLASFERNLGAVIDL
jgi:hypothetical protein